MSMNPRLARLHPYPFERWRELAQDIVPAAHLAPISLGIGEPRHKTPALIEETMVRALPGLSSYPSTLGEPALREAIRLKDRTVFLDVRTDPTENVWPMVQAGKGISEMLLGSEDL